MNKNIYESVSIDVQDESDAPKGKDIYYKCNLCSIVIPSQPVDNIGCKCGNIFIDIDYFRLVVRDFNAFEVVKEIKDTGRS